MMITLAKTIACSAILAGSDFSILANRSRWKLRHLPTCHQPTCLDRLPSPWALDLPPIFFWQINCAAKRPLNMANCIALVIGPDPNPYICTYKRGSQFACSALPLKWKLGCCSFCCSCNANAWVNWLQLHLRHLDPRRESESWQKKNKNKLRLSEMPPKVFCSIEAFDCTPLETPSRRKLQLHFQVAAVAMTQSGERWR